MAEKEKSYSKSQMIGKIVLFAVLCLFAIILFIPLYWMVQSSFDAACIVDAPFPPRWFPKEPSLEPYRLMFTQLPMLSYIKNTFIVAIGVILVSGTSSMLAAYALSKIKFKGHSVVLMMTMSVLMIPFELIMIPLYSFFSQVGLSNSYWCMWLPGLVYTFGTFFGKQYLDGIPDALREAAMIDGAGEIRTFVQIYVPLMGSIIATIVVLLFLGAWNDLMWPMIALSSRAKWTIQIGLSTFTTEKGATPAPALRMAGACVSLIPVLILYLFLQRFIVESIALSGIKQ